MRNFEVDVNQKVFKVQVTELVEPGQEKAAAGAGAATATLPKRTLQKTEKREAAAGSGHIQATMHGLFKELQVDLGAKVVKGQRIAIFEAMKMESDITSDRDGTVKEIKVKAGQTVDSGTLLFVIGD